MGFPKVFSFSHGFSYGFPRGSRSLPWRLAGGSLQHPELRALRGRRLGRVEPLVEVQRQLRQRLPRAAPGYHAAAQQLREAGAGKLGGTASGAVNGKDMGESEEAPW